jgi:hypothetical protein
MAGIWVFNMRCFALYSGEITSRLCEVTDPSRLFMSYGLAQRGQKGIRIGQHIGMS